MKRIIKKVFFGIFRMFSVIKTTAFSDFFISFGYLIKSEGLFNSNGAKNLDWDRLEIHTFLATKKIDPTEEILFMEFGVYLGQTFSIWVEENKNQNSRFIGFDTFSGLPEDWGSIKKGTFSAQGKLPEVGGDTRCSFCVGLIQDTLPDFVKTLEKGKRKVIHIDVDLYNATMITLINLHSFLEKGDILIFDDFYSVTKSSHEFKAFLDYLLVYKTSHVPLYNSRNGHYMIEIA